LPGLVHVIDDDASFRTAVARRLKLAGYDVETYSSAQQLLDRLPDAQKPGCILLDVQMPGLSGPELQSRLIELGSVLPIVFVTGHADTPATVRAIKLGVGLIEQIGAIGHTQLLECDRAIVGDLIQAQRQRRQAGGFASRSLARQ